MFLKNYLFKILPINDKFLQNLLTFFYCYVYVIPFPNFLEILNDFKLHFCQLEESQASIF